MHIECARSGRGLFGFSVNSRALARLNSRDLVAGDHPCQHLHAAIHVKRVDLGERAVLADILLDQQLVVRQRSDLRRVGDADAPDARLAVCCSSCPMRPAARPETPVSISS